MGMTMPERVIVIDPEIMNGPARPDCMKVLLDECLPVDFRHSFPNHEWAVSR